jgi:hypothetical protein
VTLVEGKADEVYYPDEESLWRVKGCRRNFRKPKKDDAAANADSNSS